MELATTPPAEGRLSLYTLLSHVSFLLNSIEALWVSLYFFGSRSIIDAMAIVLAPYHQRKTN